MAKRPKKNIFKSFRRQPSSTPEHKSRPASKGFHRLMSLLCRRGSSPSPHMPRSPSPSRRQFSSQAVRPRADSLPEHSDARFPAGASDSDAPSSGDQPADPGNGVEPSAAYESPSRATIGLAVFKSALQITERAADVFPPLKSAVGGLLGILDLVETVVDVHEKFKRITEKVSLVTEVVEMYRSLDSGRQGEMMKYLDKVADELNAVEEIVQKKQDRKISKRIVLAPADVDEVERQFRAVGDATDLFLLLVNVRHIAALEELRRLNQSSHANSASRIQFDYLDKLSGSESARYDAIDIPFCTTDTRIQLLEDVFTWAACNEGEDVPSIFFLNGVAGSGKSTIAKTLCASWNHAGRLGASFFCSRRKAEQRDVRSIFRTLAYLLSLSSPSFADEVVKVLRENPLAASANIEEQFRLLISDPATAAFTAVGPVPVVVVDALDECDDADATENLLKVIVKHGRQLPLKFFVTSRPEHHIRTMFRQPGSRHLRLRDIERDIVDEDIRISLTAELSDFEDVQLSPEDIKILVDRSQGLFIYAATACKYIKARDVPEPPQERLRELVAPHADHPPTGIDEMYDYILGQALQRLNGDQSTRVLRCLHAVVCARNPLSVPELAHLLCLTPDQVRYALVALHSVINVPDHDEEHGLLTTYHASFPDYLTTRTRSGSKRWAADTGATHLDVFLGCNKIMETGLFFNVSGCSTSYASNAKQPSRRELPSYLVYACRFWIEHLTMSSVSEERATQDVLAFFENKFLYWLEVLSVCNYTNVASSLIVRLEVWLREQQTRQNTENADVSRCLRLLLDANDFLIRFGMPIHDSAPHIYISALAFTPPKSQISQVYLALLERRLKVDTAERLTPLPLLEIHEHRRWTSQLPHWRALAFSADSSYILSAADDNLCRWDARTGESIGQPQQGPDIPHSRLALSPDGSRAVSWSESTGCVWDTTLDHPIGRSLKVPTDATSVSLVVFSPDGKCVAAAGITMAEGRDSVICKWDAATGDPIGQPLELAGSALKGWLSLIAFAPDYKRIAATYPRDNLGLGKLTLWDAETGAAIVEEFADVNSAVFSPDSAFVVYGELGGAIHARDAETGDAIGQPLNGHTMTVCSLAFSPDGKFVASGSADTTVRVWSFEHGRLGVHRVLKGHTSSTESVVFSPDGHFLASTSDDGDICIWDVAQTTTGDAVSIGEPPGHTDAVGSVAFSPDGRQVASASCDGTVRVWDADTGAAVGEPLLGRGHEYTLKSTTFSLDGRLVAASFYDDTIQVWETDTGTRVGPLLKVDKRGGDCIALSPDGKLLAYSSDYSVRVRIWNTHIEQSCMDHTHTVTSLAFSPDGKHLASAFYDGTVRVWDAQTGALVLPPLTGHTDTVWSVAFSPDAQHIATGSGDKTVRIWDVTVGASHAPKIVTGSDSPSLVDLWESHVAEFDRGYDGWIVGPHEELFLWIPPGYRTGLLWPRMTAVIGVHPVRLDLRQFAHGSTWTECWGSA
ncbi:uncharacterized protein C8Q71DRAFT_837694 [Rhodofomes roseus]|uniref:Nephrocystin 3-like N-terminal domain-containing protein n=1 Tax=Rhodofomes roseus TaxID=34475 RepID=A0ABQ8KBG3_9APHY|nr:uncharacterized protein C8Q71DRAFT_837694 [Rhodofomes roseus]KAH9834893.1 hypothetical protein C8Q71DRAFT_837694 [Rhodofomes roseus]